jgi:signal peptide peptidase SppA
MKRFSRIIEHVHYQPWLISPTGHAAIRQLLESKLAGQVPAEFWSGSGQQRELPAAAGPQVDRQGVAHLPVSGTLGNRLSWLEKICGGVDYQDVAADLQNALEEGARGILLHIDSPGGMANGAGETAERIAAAGVPVVAYTDSMMCSAAYYLAASADKILASPSAAVGSIGVMLPWVDQSRLWAAAGLEFAPILSEDSELKLAGAGPSLSPAQRRYLQEQADALYQAFTGFVSRYREIDFAALAGGSYFGQAAVSANLVDGIATYADAYETLLALVDNA